MPEQRSLWDQPPPEPEAAPVRADPADPARHRPESARPQPPRRRCGPRRRLGRGRGQPALVPGLAGTASSRSRTRAARCARALFRDELRAPAVRPAHGMQVIIHGRVRVYEPQGAYQLYVDSITAAGAGDLHARYEALRAKLAAEGLFDERRKRPIPRWPRRIGVVTSPVGVVWRDIANVLRRRYPLVELVLSASVVQGDAAAPAIVRALQRLYAQPGPRHRHPRPRRRLARGPVELQRRARRAGRGQTRRSRSSWASATSRTRRSRDFAADLRAPTPSAAAELATPDGTQLPTIVDRLRDRAGAALLGRRRRDAASSTRRPARWRGWRPTSGRRGSARPTCSIVASRTAGRPPGAPPPGPRRGPRRVAHPLAGRHARARLRGRAHRRRPDRARRREPARPATRCRSSWRGVAWTRASSAPPTAPRS